MQGVTIGGERLSPRPRSVRKAIHAREPPRDHADRRQESRDPAAARGRRPSGDAAAARAVRRARARHAGARRSGARVSAAELRARLSGLASGRASARRARSRSSSVATSAAASTTGPAAIRGSAFAARSTAGIATPSRHATIIDERDRQRRSCRPRPSRRATRSTTTPDHRAARQAEQRRRPEFLPQRADSRFQTIGPSVRPCSVSVSACMLTLSPSASTIGMNSASTTTSCEQVLEAAGDERRQQPAGDVAEQPRKAIAERRSTAIAARCRGRRSAGRCRRRSAARGRSPRSVNRLTSTTPSSWPRAVDHREREQPAGREVFAGDQHGGPVGDRDHVVDHDVARPSAPARRSAAGASARRRPACSSSSTT